MVKKRIRKDNMIQKKNQLELTCTGDREWVFPDQDTTEEIYEMFDMAVDLMDESRYGSAKSMLKDLLKLKSDHIDAIHHLAIIEDRKKNKERSRVLWEQGVEIGRSAIPKRFKRGSSRIPWSYLENRPFLRCLHGYAWALREDGRMNEALDAFKEILDYNPDDNQGARDILMDMYLEKLRYGDAVELAARYDDDASPSIMYGKALALFLLGRKSEADETLLEALSFNTKVAQELMKKKHTKTIGPIQGCITVGGWDEAYEYWETQGKYWTKDAIEWLRHNIP